MQAYTLEAVAAAGQAVLFQDRSHPVERPPMAATEQLFNVRERKRFERHDIWERIAENGTISAAVMVFAAIAAVICANTDAYGPSITFGDPAVCGSGQPAARSHRWAFSSTTSSWRFSFCWWAST